MSQLIIVDSDASFNANENGRKLNFSAAFPNDPQTAKVKSADAEQPRGLLMPDPAEAGVP
jgi:hypothetical protein